MSKKRIGFNKLVETIGVQFFEEHKNYAVFSSEETENGLFCFLGIDLHPEKSNITLSCSIDDWDVYATCYVRENEVVLDKCKLPL